MKRVPDREHAIYSLGFITGQKVFSKRPNLKVLSAEIDNVLVTDWMCIYQYYITDIESVCQYDKSSIKNKKHFKVFREDTGMKPLCVLVTAFKYSIDKFLNLEVRNLIDENYAYVPDEEPPGKAVYMKNQENGTVVSYTIEEIDNKLCNHSTSGSFKSTDKPKKKNGWNFWKVIKEIFRLVKTDV